MCAVSVTWNGTAITAPVLIYHEEVLADPEPPYLLGDDLNRTGALVCRSESRTRAAWRYTDGEFFDDVTIRMNPRGGYQQIRSDNVTVPSVSRLSRVSPTAANEINGLWTCRVQVIDEDGLQDVLDNFVFVGLYHRGEGEYSSTG